MKKSWPAIFVLTICLVFQLRASAQFMVARVYINGLTCSLCSRGVEKSLMKLKFIDKIKMDLNNNMAEITFIPRVKVTVNDIADQVLDAGFSVRSLEADYQFDDVVVYEGSNFTDQSDTYVFVEVNKAFLKGIHTIVFKGKKFMDGKEYSSWSGKNKISKTKQGPNEYFITL